MNESVRTRRNGLADSVLDDDPLWYKDAILYEVPVRAYYDSNGDGIGDFRGLTEKLDYLRDLGITAIWLLPFYPSPLRDDGYDIADYTAVHPAYGTLRDVRQFVQAAHRRGLRVITELVCNHTSDQHPWFQRARRAKPGSAWRNFYVWSDTPERYQDARIIFKDFETSNWTWDPVAQAYYWHRFYSHQPDLNYENPQVRRAIFKVMDFWLQMGVDGLRLDAVPYLYEREGTNCENLRETHEALKELRAHIDARFRNRMLLAEANQWPEDAVAYFGNGDECHMAFHFPVMPRLFMAIRMEDRYPIVDILAQTPPIPANAQWALFLRNHDELTLEMVTDEERDYMYRVYAHDPQMRINLGIRRRLAPLLGNHRRRIELMNGLLFSLPGTPVIYYGDELGMGDNIYLGDRNGVRTPMQWSADRNAGFSTANRQQLYEPVVVDYEYHYEAVNVEAQQNNPHSLLWWMKRLIALRKRYKAFSRGTLEFLQPENRKVLAFVRQYEDERILVVANLSRFVQAVELDLSAYRDLMPVELFGRIEFPPVRDAPYFITLGPHAFYWFSLEPQRVPAGRLRDGRGGEMRPLTVGVTWDELVLGAARAALAEVLPGYLQEQRWFRAKARRIKGAQIVDAIPLPARVPPPPDEPEIGQARLRQPRRGHDETGVYLTFVRVEYTEGDAQTYVLLLAAASGERAETLCRERPAAVLARYQGRGGETEGVLYDAFADREVATVLLEEIVARRRQRGMGGELVGLPTAALRRLLPAGTTPPEPSVLRAEQTNTSIAYDERLILKLFRQLEAGTHPDVEVSGFLTERDFAHTPPLAGVLEYRPERGAPASLGMLQGYVPNQGDAWRYTLDSLGDYLERCAANPAEVPEATLGTAGLLQLAASEAPLPAYEAVGAYLNDAWLLGQRTGELHCALASDPEDPQFAPEPISSFYQRSLYQSMRTLGVQTFQTLRKAQGGLPEAAREPAQQVLALQGEVLARFQAVTQRPIAATRIRTHGDYHLGQVLYTGKDFVIIDFEGEPARPLSERRLKRSPLRDVAGMLRSFHYAVCAALRDQEARGLLRPEQESVLGPWASYWQQWVSATFLRGYLGVAGEASFVPRALEELQVLLDAHLLEKAVYELGYELNNRPDWVGIPLQGILQVMGAAPAPAVPPRQPAAAGRRTSDT
ncbi:MAG TPA: maltose alpha-D-glucosyltransferase [Chloroflexota bacterium]|nr:maltose alpha-D-glucosyltransferase [Chloroflexota bacterium]